MPESRDDQSPYGMGLLHGKTHVQNVVNLRDRGTSAHQVRVLALGLDSGTLLGLIFVEIVAYVDLADDLLEARDSADARLSEVVEALETIRLELLRLHAGSGSVESMTADLSSARELSDDIQRVLEGGREVEGLLEGINR